MAAKGQYFPTTTVYLDNKCTILLEEIGKSSGSKRSCHLNVRNIFVTDKIKKGAVKIVFYPMKDILGDFFFEALLESLFIQMPQRILNQPSSTSTSLHRSVLEDRKRDKNKWVLETPRS